MNRFSQSMIFRQRARQAECLDEPQRTDDEIREAYLWLGKINDLTRFSRPFEIAIPRELGESECRALTLLDVGSGDGMLGRCLTPWAARRGWRWDVTNCDINPRSLSLNPGGKNVAGSATALPFDDGAFDVAIASQMTHHLDSDADVARHFSEAFRVARKGVAICDLHRNPFFFVALGFTTLCMGMPAWIRRDGLLSVRRGWRVPEWERLAQLAELKNYRVWMEHGVRVLLFARKG